MKKRVNPVYKCEWRQIGRVYFEVSDLPPTTSRI